jgi:hypothetical protein
MSVSPSTLALLVATVLVGCRHPTDPLDRMRVSVAVAPHAITPAAPIWIDVTFVNESHHTVNLPVSSCAEPFAVFDSTGRFVAPAPFNCAGVGLPPVPLSPGGRYVVTSRWNGAGKNAAGEWSARVPAGRYSIIGRLYSGGPQSTPVTVVVE